VETSIDSVLESAMQALSNHDPETAVAKLEALLDGHVVLPEVPQMLAHGILATALAALGRISAARAEAEKAIWIASDLGDSESRAHYEGLLRQLDVVGMSDDAVEQAFERAGRARDEGDIATAENELNMVLIAALAHLRADLEASARGMLGETLLMRGAIPEAKVHLERALEIARELADESAAHHFEAVLASLGTPEGADRYRVEADVARHADEVQKQAGKAMEAGDFESAITLLEPVAKQAEAAHALASEASLRGMLAQAHLLANHRKDAEIAARRALEIAEQLGAKDAADGFRQILQLAMGWTTPVAKA
jgi:tetratricopeptide (TPR) repeat protein